MPSVSLPVAAVAAAGISAAGSLGGGAISAAGAEQAAKTQLQMYQQTRSDLAPFRQGGASDFAAYNNLSPFSFGQFNFDPTMAQLEQTPGYQFTLQQGLKSTQNGATARGLGVSGAAQKAASSYATGLASQTYQNQFQNALAGYQSNYNTAQGVYSTNANRLLQGATLGENAAAQTGTIGASLAGNAGTFQAGAGSALGAGFQGATNQFAYPFLQSAYQAPIGAGAPANPLASSELAGLY